MCGSLGGQNVCLSPFFLFILAHFPMEGNRFQRLLKDPGAQCDPPVSLEASAPGQLSGCKVSTAWVTVLAQGALSSRSKCTSAEAGFPEKVTEHAQAGNMEWNGGRWSAWDAWKRTDPLLAENEDTDSAFCLEPLKQQPWGAPGQGVPRDSGGFFHLKALRLVYTAKPSKNKPFHINKELQKLKWRNVSEK